MTARFGWSSASRTPWPALAALFLAVASAAVYQATDNDLFRWLATGFVTGWAYFWGYRDGRVDEGKRIGQNRFHW